MTELDAGPAAEASDGIRNSFRPFRGQPSFCLLPPWFSTMIVDPAIIRSSRAPGRPTPRTTDGCTPNTERNAELK